MKWNAPERFSAIGIDIDGRTICAAQLKHSADGWSVASAIELPRVNRDVPIDKAEIQRLSDVLARHGFRGDRVVVAVPSNHVLTGVFDLPPVGSGAPLDQLARMELARMHKCDPQALELMHWHLPPRLRAGGANEARASSHVMAAACQASDAVPLIELFESEEWTVEALDIQSWAMARACEPLISPTETSTVLLSLRWDVATLVLLHKGVVAYHRVLDDAGLKHLHQAMMESANVTSEIADHLLRANSNNDAAIGGAPTATTSALSAVIGPHADTIMREIRTSCSYVSHRYADAGAGPRRVLVFGEGAATPGLAHHLARGLSMEVAVVSPSFYLTSPGWHATSLPAFANLPHMASNPSVTLAVGLALRDDTKRETAASITESEGSETDATQDVASSRQIRARSFNLIPAARRESQRRQARRRLWFKLVSAYGLLLVLALILSRVMSGFDSRAVTQTLASMQSEISRSESEVRSLRAELKAAFHTWQTSNFVSNQPDWSLLLAVLSQNLDTELVLKSCALKQETDSAPSTGSQPTRTHVLTLTGLGQTQLAITQFVVRLEQLQIFNAVKLLETRREPFLEDDAVAFRLTCTLQDQTLQANGMLSKATP